jgi:hypothetical protein
MVAIFTKRVLQRFDSCMRCNLDGLIRCPTHVYLCIYNTYIHKYRHAYIHIHVRNCNRHKLIPIFGMMESFVEFIFVKRNWQQDKRQLEAGLQGLVTVSKHSYMYASMYIHAYVHNIIRYLHF